MTMRVLITGALGFLGRHLAAAGRERGAKVIGIAHHRMIGKESEYAPEALLAGDICDPEFVAAAVDRAGPTHVFHLAGVIGSAVSADEMYRVHVMGTVTLLEAIRRSGRKPPTIVSSSSAVYGSSARSSLAEDEPIRPVASYGASKAAEEIVAAQFATEHGLPVAIARCFNLIGPGLSDKLVPGVIARQIAEAEQRGGGKIVVGNLTTRRDYTDVRDVAAAHLLLAESASRGEIYNVCTGRSRSIEEMMGILKRHSRVRVEVVIDAARLRPSDTADQIGDPSKVTALTNWSPRISFDQSLIDLLDWWRRKVKGTEQ
jgi:nucleoside-diphosphate-sugar epimerase